MPPAGRRHSILNLTSFWQTQVMHVHVNATFLYFIYHYSHQYNSKIRLSTNGVT